MGVPYLTSYAGKFTIDIVACLELIRSISGRRPVCVSSGLLEKLLKVL